MGLHDKGNREVRKRKYADQFTKTANNKKRKALKLQKRLEKAKLRRQKKEGK